ncbi:Uu.00g038560.m01.CDS01 [Anthostomella pinea]|uniref:Uu.00g038560.m01.CDS01 n=1 Tax=Anthostomella pinea TaxID=933095 RepID=A0AAI8YDW4_9PEZI|nr:Uu.00g038560.m01.CDS01 [Anthostomella pinea]
MPALAEGLTLVDNPSRGRGITASRAFSPGATIAVFSNPSIAIPDSPHLDQTCNLCLAIDTNLSSLKLRACTGCRVVVYCSPACQKADWQRVHKGECKVFKRVRAEGHDFLPTPVRALVQVLLRPEMQAAAAEMEGHVDAFRTAGGKGKAWTDMELQAMAALHYMGREASPRSLGQAVEVLYKLQVNSFNRMDVDIGQTGLFLNPALAMVNHSCVPNAFVQFVGRHAVLHAYREIKEGEEIEISYIDCNLHRAHRQEALKIRYHFNCSCPRCKDDLDVYQVCQRYPHLELNSLSLVPDLQKLRDPSIGQSLHSDSSLQINVEEIYPGCSASLQGLSSTDKIKSLRRRWRACEQLHKARLYAIEPLNQVLVEVAVYFGENGNFEYSLAISCFLALNSDPFRAPMPFAPQRVKGLLMIGKLLANTAPADHVTSEGTTAPLANKISQALSRMDQATTCQVMLALVVHYGPAAHSKEWPIYRQAVELLDDLESLPGRETEHALVTAFMRNPNGPEERRFFETAVLGPIQLLSDFALEVMASELGS